MLIRDLLQALCDHLRREIRNGQLTERGLARRAGVSQAHVHNVLKGARPLSPAIADRLLTALNRSVREFVCPDRCPGV